MDSDKTVRPAVLLSVPDGIFLTVGMVIGVGIFKLPSLVAGNTGSAAQFLLAWGLGVLGERTRSRDWSARTR